MSSAKRTTDDRELVIIRTFDAPRDLAWRAWTEAERTKQWMAPTGFTIPLSDGDLRPGGVWRCHMISPEGQLYRFASVDSRKGHEEGWIECFEKLDALLTAEARV